MGNPIAAESALVKAPACRATFRRIHAIDLRISTPNMQGMKTLTPQVFWPLSLVITTMCLWTSSLDAQDKPNIIIVMVDDMGYGDLSATGNPIIRTPHIKKLKAEGGELTTFYVSPVCSPTRAALMTGRYNYRTRVVDTFKGRSMMEPEEVTMAEVFQAGGYATGIFGKWHLGDNYPLRPQDQGFEEVLIHRGGGLAQPSEPLENEGRYTDAILFHNGNSYQSKGYCTDVYFDFAFEFMREAKAEKKPFLAFIPPNAPHGPFHDVPEKALAHYKSVDLSPLYDYEASERVRDTTARIFAMIENIDENMGRLRGFLEEEALAENTIVIFMTDNGPAGKRYNGPFRGTKTQTLEGGIRTPFYIKWPAKIASNFENDAPAAHIDLLPTLAALADVPLPEIPMDGLDLSALFSKDEEAAEAASVRADQRPIVIQTHRGDYPQQFHHIAVRQGGWKLLRNSGFGHEIDNGNTPFELYHVENDLGEETNLADKHPDRVKRLQKAYLEWFADVSSTRPHNYAPPRIVLSPKMEPKIDLSIQDWRVPGINEPGWGSEGSWLVTLEEPLKLKVTAHWGVEVEVDEVTLRVGKRRLSSKQAEKVKTAELGVLELSAGEHNFALGLKGFTPKQRDQVFRFLTLEEAEK